MDLKTRLSALLADDSYDGENRLNLEDSPENENSSTALVNTSNQSSTYDDTTETMTEPTLYEATYSEIERWHAFGFNVFLQKMLPEYDLGGYDTWTAWAYDRFKIGMNTKQHFATFAVDDTHFYKIPFDKFNTTPIDRAQARCVLEKISQLRDEICGGRDKRYFRATIALDSEGRPTSWQIERKENFNRDLR